MASSLITALDNTSKQGIMSTRLGENGHLEYSWSSNEDMRESLLQLYFQIVRCDIEKRSDLFSKFQTLIQSAYIEYKKLNEETKEVALEVLQNAYKMIAYTRDIITGKGEYRLSYSLLRAWYEAGIIFGNEAESFFVNTAKDLLKLFLQSNEEDEHPYGSWKDVKYIAQDKYALMAKNQNVRLVGFEEFETDGLINYAVELMIERIKKDLNILYQADIQREKGEVVNPNISLVARWVPREKSSKFGALSKYIAHKYFKSYLKTANSSHSLFKAHKKAQTDFRHTIVKLNKYLNTIQIKQCSQTWSEINFEKHVPSIAMTKQKKAFLNSKNKESEDRVQCANNFKEFLQKAQKGNAVVKGKRVFVGDFVKEARHILSKRRFLYTEEGQEQFNNEKLALDLAWKDNATQNSKLGNFIAMVDVSGSMDSDNNFPMNSAIGLGIRIAENSVLGSRVLTFSQEPTWVNLENTESFVEKVRIVQDAPWGMNTNFYAALKMILDAAVEAKMTSDDVASLTLVVLSDMQMDDADKGFLVVENKDSIHSISKSKQLDRNIDELFYQTGMKVSGEPWKVPHIVFWNLRSTKGFPSISNKQNTTMVSGGSSSLLNAFCDKGVETIQGLNPYKFMTECLENKRYKCLNTLLTDKLF